MNQMRAKAERILRFRPFISYATLFAFLFMAVSGIILYLLPVHTEAGDCVFLGVTVRKWTDVHIVLSLLFIVFGVIHIYLNLKPLIHYIRINAKGAVEIKPEAFLALLIVGIIVAGTMLSLPPFSTLVELGEKAKDVSRITLPTPASTVNKFEEEFECDGNNGCGKGRGLGIMTLEELCEAYQLNLPKSLALLKERLPEVTAKSYVRRIADELKVFPDNILRFLQRGR